MDNAKKKSFIAIIIIIMVFGGVKYLKLTEYLTLSYLHSNMHLLQTIISEHYVFSVFCYMVSFIVATMFSIPGSSIFTTAAGLLFGWPGLLYAVLSATSGATLLFLASRYFIGSWVQQKYAQPLKGFNNEIQQYGHYYLLIIRLIAVLPFCLVNMLSGLTIITISSFIIMTLIGLIPVSTVYIFAGKQLSKLATPEDFFSPPVVVAFSVFVLFKVALAPAVFKIAQRMIKLIAKKKVPNVKKNNTVFNCMFVKKSAHQKQV